MTSIDIKESNTTKNEILADSKLEQEKLSIEKLQTITNHEFLSISPENRLQYITKRNITSNDLVKNNLRIKTLEFSFTFFDGKKNIFNEDLYKKTTAGQVLPKEVVVIEKAGEIYSRKTLKGEFFTSGGKRLLIKDIDRHGPQERITIKKIRTKEEITKLQEDNNKSLQAFEKSKDYKQEYSDIASEAIKRGIDPKFVILAFSEKVKDLPLVSQERKVLVEDMFTEFDRKKGVMYIGPDIKNTDKGFQARMFKSLYPGKWKEKIKEGGLEISKEVIQSVDKIASYETKSEFVSLVKKESKIVEQKYGVPWEVTLGQAILESGYGQSKLSKKYNNFFGHNAKPGEPYVIMNDHGHNRMFRVYSSVLEGLEAHGKFLSSPRYYKAMILYGRKNGNSGNPRKFLEEINNAGYSETSDYADRIANVLKSNGVYI